MRIIGKYERGAAQAVSGHAMLMSTNKDIAPVYIYGSQVLLRVLMLM